MTSKNTKKRLYDESFVKLGITELNGKPKCVCSNLSNYKQQTESHQQHLALYTDRHLQSVAIMTEVTCHHMECTHFNLDYTQMSTVALK